MREEQQMEKKTEAKQIHLDQVLPGQIEAKSFEIIGQELQEMGIRLKPEEELVIKRAIHASADFDYAQNLVFSPEAVGAGLEAIRKGCHIVTDTRMAWSGINKGRLSAFGGEAVTFMSDEDVAEAARQAGSTRAPGADALHFCGGKRSYGSDSPVRAGAGEQAAASIDYRYAGGLC